jgi:uncharacterized damage-inducible protein DinB
MTPEQATAIRDFLLEQFRADHVTTARVLESVPQDKCSYRPGDRGMSGQELTHHIAAADIYFLTSVANGEFTSPDDAEIRAIESCAAVAALYRERVPALLDRIQALTGEQLAAPTRFHVWDLPLVKLLHFGLLHSVHHRGQLSAMLRPMGGKVPSIYGGSLDEPLNASASATE